MEWKMVRKIESWRVNGMAMCKPKAVKFAGEVFSSPNDALAEIEE
jgi:hypothetical protein